MRQAHCVSSWGHDFRKDYGELKQLREYWPNIPILALTATARKAVSDDVIKILGIQNCTFISCGFDRPNLYFEIREKPKRAAETLARVVHYIKEFSTSSIGTTGNSSVCLCIV